MARIGKKKASKEKERSARVFSRDRVVVVVRKSSSKRKSGQDNS